jgi:hypothetical protein
MLEPIGIALPHCGGDDAGERELVPGQLECEAFAQARAAYDPREPETETRMVAAFKRFHDLGYQAYFQGVTAMPVLIASQPLLAAMWMDGFQAAQMAALARKCNCQCARQYDWGVGYAPCPRRSAAFAEQRRLAASMKCT